MTTTQAKKAATSGSTGLPTIEVYSTLTKKKTPLVTVKPGHVGMYLCGPTVYKPSHIGHMVGPVIFDTVKRHLAYSGWSVTWVVNVTDVDDKIIAESTARGTTMAKLAAEMTADYLENLAALGVTGIDEMPKATEHIGTIVAFIEGLIAKGYAYASDGDVYFDVTKDSDYGKLTNRSVEQTQGEGGSTAERKRSAADFALWKKAKAGEPAWDSPWGPGRPGWHIECSAMVREELGDTIDIHLGGADLVFPHHENEIAQSEAASGKELARYWLHNGMVNVGGQKMSKSLGNFTTIRALLDSGVSPMTLRLFTLQAHYRKPLDFTADALEAAATGWKGLNAALGLALSSTNAAGSAPATTAEPAVSAAQSPSDPAALPPALARARQRFAAAMDDDLNTSAALAVLFELAKPLRSLANRLERGDADAAREAQAPELDAQASLLHELAAVLGLRHETSPTAASGSTTSAAPAAAEIEAQIQARQAAKAARDFATADRIRDALKARGIELIDKPGGLTDWIQA